MRPKQYISSQIWCTELILRDLPASLSKCRSRFATTESCYHYYLKRPNCSGIADRLCLADAHSSCGEIRKTVCSRPARTRQSTQLHRRSQPHHYLYRAISTRRNDILLIEINNVDRCTVPHEHSPQSDITGRKHVPNGDAAILARWSIIRCSPPTRAITYFRAGHEDAMSKSQVQHRLAMVINRIYTCPRRKTPNAHRRVAGTTDDDVVVILQAQHAANMASQYPHALQGSSIPHLRWKVVSTTGKGDMADISIQSYCCSSSIHRWGVISDIYADMNEWHFLTAGWTMTLMSGWTKLTGARTHSFGKWHMTDVLFFVWLVG